MTVQELWDALHDIYAYDIGATDSGIKDERLARRCIERLSQMSTDEIKDAMARDLRDRYLSDEAIAQGYGAEDVAEFVRWFDDDLTSLH